MGDSSRSKREEAGEFWEAAIRLWGESGLSVRELFGDNYQFPLTTTTFFRFLSLLPLGYHWPPWGPPKIA